MDGRNRNTNRNGHTRRIGTTDQSCEDEETVSSLLTKRRIHHSGSTTTDMHISLSRTNMTTWYFFFLPKIPFLRLLRTDRTNRQDSKDIQLHISTLALSHLLSTRNPRTKSQSICLSVLWPAGTLCSPLARGGSIGKSGSTPESKWTTVAGRATVGARGTGRWESCKDID